MACIRTATNFSQELGFFVTRFDLFDNDSAGEPVHIFVDVKHGAEEIDAQTKEMALMVLKNSAEHQGIDLRSLRPFADAAG